VKKVKNLKFLFGLSAFEHIVDGPIRGFIEKTLTYFIIFCQKEVFLSKFTFFFGNFSQKKC
jgi:hypothetical protein